jgi:hypothetical protein
MENRQLNALFARLNELEKSVLEYPANDFASYRERVGQYSGLKEAIQILTDLERDLDE